MFKFLLAAVFVQFTLPCFSTDLLDFSDSSNSYISESMDSVRQSNQLPCLLNGTAALLQGDLTEALDNFETALTYSDPYNPSTYVIDFLSFLGQIVAYDAQGDAALCKQSIGSLFLTLNTWESILESDSSTSSDSSLSSLENFYMTEVHSEFKNLIESIISVAPSEEVRTLLSNTSFFLIEELLSSFNTLKEDF